MVQGADTDPNTINFISEKLKEKVPFNVEILNYSKAKKPYWIKLDITPIFNQVGELTNYIAIQEDISERKATELELQNINAELIRAQSIGSIGSWSFEPKTGIIDWSDQTFYIYDRDLELGPPSFDEFLSYHQKSDPNVQILIKALQTGASYDVDIKLITKNGEDKYIRTVGIPEKNNLGEVVTFSGVAQDITDQKLAELELLESEHRLKAITDNIEGLVQRQVFHEDGTNKITYISKGVEKLTGLTQLQILQDHTLLIKQVYEDDKYGIMNSLNASINEMKLWDHSWRIYHPNGETKWVRAIGFPRKDSDSNSIILDSFVLDITKEITAEETLKSINDRLIEAQDIAHIGDWWIDMITGEGHISPIIKNIFEIDYSFDLKSGFDFYKVGKHRNRIEFVVNEALNKGTPYDEELLIISGNGKEKWIRTNGRATFKMGKCIRLSGTLMDIDAKKKLELELIENEQTLSAAIQGADLGVWDYNVKTGINKANKRWFEMFGYEPKEEYKTVEFISSIFHPDDFQTISNEIQRIEDGGENNIDQIIRVFCKDGSIKYVLDRARIVEFDVNGNASRIIGTHLDITETVLLQNEIEENRQRLDAAINGAKLGVWDLDLVTNAIKTNSLYRELLGYSEDNFVNTQDFFLSILHPEDHHLIHNEIVRLESSGDNLFDLTLRLKHADGNYHTFLDRGKIIEYGENGTIHRMIGTIMDITEQHVASQKLIENEQKYRNLFNNLIDEVHLWRVIRDKNEAIVNWELVDANPTALLAWGKAKDQIIGKTTDEIFNNDAINLFLPTIKKIFETGEPESWTTFFPPTNQHLFMTSIPYDDFFISTGRDITEQLLLEKELDDNKFRIETAVKGANLGVWDANIRDEHVIVNNRWLEILGYNREEVVDPYSLFFSSLHPDDVPKVKLGIQQAEQSEAKSFEIIIRVRAKSGDYRTIIDRGSALDYDSNGKLIRMIGTHLDITEQYELQKKIESSLHEKEILLSEIHHRVKNNLAIISGLLDLQAFENTNKEVSNIILNIGQRIKSIAGVHELLYNSDSFTEIPFSQYLNNLIKNINSSFFNNKNITFKIDVNEHLNININQAVPLALLLNELLTNSFKYAFENVKTGNIYFSLNEENGIFTAVFKDNGPGIDLEKFKNPKTLGFTLISTLLSQLQAEEHFIMDDGFGITFSFESQKYGSHSNL